MHNITSIDLSKKCFFSIFYSGFIDKHCAKIELAMLYGQSILLLRYGCFSSLLIFILDNKKEHIEYALSLITAIISILNLFNPVAYLSYTGLIKINAQSWVYRI